LINGDNKIFSRNHLTIDNMDFLRMYNQLYTSWVKAVRCSGRVILSINEIVNYG
jgi:hypothetical protein